MPGFFLFGLFRKKDDVLFGDGENNVLEGGAGSDRLFGLEGDDAIDGGKGADLLEGGGGHDMLFGGRGKDFLDGGEGNDTLFGERGRDVLEGGAGSDTLDGGKGRDILNGGDGSDILTGGAGRDVFVFDGDQLGNGPDEITDFSIRQDKFALDASDFDVEGFRFVNAAVDDIDADANVIVLQGGFANAGAAAAAIAGNDAIQAEDGFFVYFNENLQINRLVYSEDLGEQGAISVLANLTNLNGDEALDALPSFGAENFDLL